MQRKFETAGCVSPERLCSAISATDEVNTEYGNESNGGDQKNNPTEVNVLIFNIQELLYWIFSYV